jgi:hypothetical protein
MSSNDEPFSFGDGGSDDSGWFGTITGAVGSIWDGVTGSGDSGSSSSGTSDGLFDLDRFPNLKKLAGLGSVGVLTALQEGLKPEQVAPVIENWGILMSFVTNPVYFVRSIIIGWILGGIIDISIKILDGFATAWSQLESAITDPLAGAGTSLGDVGGTLLGVIADLDSTLAASAGPAAPFASVGTWFVVALAVGYGIRGLLEVLKWLT